MYLRNSSKVIQAFTCVQVPHDGVDHDSGDAAMPGFEPQGLMLTAPFSASLKHMQKQTDPQFKAGV